MVSHDCLICGQPCATVPVFYGGKLRMANGDRFVRGYQHFECARSRAEKARRERLAKKALEWEQAGQLRLIP